MEHQGFTRSSGRKKGKEDSMYKTYYAPSTLPQGNKAALLIPSVNLEPLDGTQEYSCGSLCTCVNAELIHLLCAVCLGGELTGTAWSES